MFTASNGHFLTHIPHPMQRTSEKKAILSSDVTCNDEITVFLADLQEYQARN